MLDTSVAKAPHQPLVFNIRRQTGCMTADKPKARRVTLTGRANSLLEAKHRTWGRATPRHETIALDVQYRKMVNNFVIMLTWEFVTLLSDAPPELRRARTGSTEFHVRPTTD
jgi:hypothetical protein